MPTIESVRAALPFEHLRESMDQLTDFYGNEKDFFAAIESDKIDDAIHEIADGNVSVYTYDRLKWLTDNFMKADQENAVACGAKNADEIAAYCWYESEREVLQNALEQIKSTIDSMES